MTRLRGPEIAVILGLIIIAISLAWGLVHETPNATPSPCASPR